MVLTTSFRCFLLYLLTSLSICSSIAAPVSRMLSSKQLAEYDSERISKFDGTAQMFLLHAASSLAGKPILYVEGIGFYTMLGDHFNRLTADHEVRMERPTEALSDGMMRLLHEGWVTNAYKNGRGYHNLNTGAEEIDKSQPTPDAPLPYTKNLASLEGRQLIAAESVPEKFRVKSEKAKPGMIAKMRMKAEKRLPVKQWTPPVVPGAPESSHGAPAAPGAINEPLVGGRPQPARQPVRQPSWSSSIRTFVNGGPHGV